MYDCLWNKGYWKGETTYKNPLFDNWLIIEVDISVVTILSFPGNKCLSWLVTAPSPAPNNRHLI